MPANHKSYFLELDSPADLRAKAFPKHVGTVTTEPSNNPTRCMFLWREVGRRFWLERSEWTHQKWDTYLRRDDVWFFVLLVCSSDAGFFELKKAGRVVKIEGFGLLPRFRGNRLGGGLLTVATRKAIEWGADRVWLHTATDDHPHALPNYLKRGYRIYRETVLRNPMQPGS